VKLLTDLQILDCELHKNAFGGPDPLESYSVPPDPLAVITGRGRGGREGRKGKERVGNREGRKGEGGMARL